MQVVDGQLNMQLDPRTKITLQDADILVSSNELLGSKNIKSLQRSLSQVRFGKGVLSINDVRVELNHVHFTGKQDQLEAEKVIVIDPTKTLSATAKDVVVNELYYHDSTKSITVEGLQWQQAVVSLGEQAKQTKPSRSSILLKNISGNNTVLSFLTPEQSVSTTIDSLSIDELRKPVDKKPEIYGLHAMGNNFSLVHHSLSIETEKYNIDDKNNSSFTNACIGLENRGLRLTTTISSVHVIPDVRDILNGNYRFETADLVNPLIYIQLKNDGAMADQATTGPLPDFYLHRLVVKNPAIYFESDDSASGTHIRLTNPENSRVKSEWLLKNINSSSITHTLAIGNLDMNGSGFSYSGKEGRHFAMDSGEVHVEAENIAVSPRHDSVWSWKANIKSADVKRLNHFNLKNKGQLIMDHASATNVVLSSTAIKSISALLSANPSFQIICPAGNYIDSANLFAWNGFVFDQTNRSLSLDSFSFRPLLPRDSLIARHAFQTDYVTATTGKVYLQGADIENYIGDSTLKASKIVIENPVITAYRDATKPFQHGRLKMLPSLLIRRFPPLISFDSIQLNEGTVIYSQVDRKTGLEGTIPLTHLSATLSPVRNYNVTAADSLQLDARAWLMDKIPVQLLARESYTDSLAGIHIVLKAGHTEMNALNRVLIPLASAKVRTGYLDTLRMDVRANEYTAYGNMQMDYRDLKITVLKKGDEHKKTAWTKLTNFAANTFLLKHNNNNKRTGVVYFERLRERSFFNYLVKMTISGIAYTTGLKKERKKINEFRRKNKA